MGEFAADSLRDSIELAWALTGRLAKVEADDMKEPVQFIAHPQIAGEWTKAVEVKKVNTPETENEIEHPNFSEITDRFIITCRYNLLAIDETLYDLAEEDMEDMTEEVRRIIKTIYSPSGDNGTFFQVSHNWQIDDEVTDSRLEKMELRRILFLTLTQIKSRSPAVFRGFGGVLTFDTSASVGDNKPIGDYIYTEVEHVQIQQGYRTIPYMVSQEQSAPKAIGVPVYYRGMFTGRFSCELWAKKQDVTTLTDEALDNIFKAQAGGELVTAVFLHANPNTEPVVVTLTESVQIQVTSFTKISGIAALVKYRLEGAILEPTVYSVV